MAKFNLTPTMIDKIKGNTILVKRDELEKVRDFMAALIDENNCLKDENKLLKKEIENKDKEIEALNKKLNSKALNDEIGVNNKVKKLEKENLKLKNMIKEMKEKHNTLEKLYLEKINELKSECSSSLKEEIVNTIRNEFKMLESEVSEKFEIII